MKQMNLCTIQSIKFLLLSLSLSCSLSAMKRNQPHRPAFAESDPSAFNEDDYCVNIYLQLRRYAEMGEAKKFQKLISTTYLSKEKKGVLFARLVAKGLEYLSYDPEEEKITGVQAAIDSGRLIFSNPSIFQAKKHSAFHYASSHHLPLEELRFLRNEKYEITTPQGKQKLRELKNIESPKEKRYLE